MRVTNLLSTTLFSVATAGLVACGGGEAAQDDQASGADAAAAGGESERYRAVVVAEGLTWEEAKARAEADGGHLVTISSAEENATVYALIAENADLWVNLDVTTMTDGEETAIQVSLGPWIGLYQEGGAPEPAGGWSWVTGEASDYTNWLTGTTEATVEPNDMGGIEHYGHFFGEGLDVRADTWNDMPNDPVTDFAAAGIEFTGDLSSPRGYIVEFEP
ncbi:MAG: hypothetical protein HKM89_13730 [Gemmatimonadales bacterium]|nr:hypothetical protein [Gemmatimonadales bacterium]